MANLHPTSELVCCAWLSTIPGSGFTAGMISTQAPKVDSWPVDNTDGISQFITCKVIGGTPRPITMTAPLAMPVFEIKCWATKIGSNKPPWFKANQLCEIIRLAMHERRLNNWGRALTPSQNGVNYNLATVHQTQMHTEPRRMYSDPRSIAMYQFDMSMTWKEVNLVIA